MIDDHAATAKQFKKKNGLCFRVDVVTFFSRTRLHQRYRPMRLTKKDLPTVNSDRPEAKDFLPTICLLLYQMAIQNTGQSAKVFLSLSPYNSPLL